MPENCFSSGEKKQNDQQEQDCHYYRMPAAKSWDVVKQAVIGWSGDIEDIHNVSSQGSAVSESLGIIGCAFGNKFAYLFRVGYVFKGWYEYGFRITEIPAGYNYHTLNLVAKWEKVTVGKPVITSFYNRSGKKAVLKYKGVSKASGYQIVYSTNKKLKKKCTTIITKSKNYTLKKLAKKKTYYVKVRAYRIDSTGKKIYGRYTGVRKVRINK